MLIPSRGLSGILSCSVKTLKLLFRSRNKINLIQAIDTDLILKWFQKNLSTITKSIIPHPFQFIFHVFLQNRVNQWIHRWVHNKKNMYNLFQSLRNDAKFEDETKTSVIPSNVTQDEKQNNKHDHFQWSFLLSVLPFHILLLLEIKSDLGQNERFLSRNVSRYEAKTPSDKYEQHAWDKLKDWYSECFEEKSKGVVSAGISENWR